MVSQTETSVAHPSHPVPGKEKRRRRKSGAVWNIHFGRRKEGECGTAAVQLVVGSRVCFLKGNASADREGFPSSFPPTQSLKKEKKKLREIPRLPRRLPRDSHSQFFISNFDVAAIPSGILFNNKK